MTSQFPIGSLRVLSEPELCTYVLLICTGPEEAPVVMATKVYHRREGSGFGTLTEHYSKGLGKLMLYIFEDVSRLDFEFNNKID